MSARILIVDGVATNRIVLNVKLIAARYVVDSVATIGEARAMLSGTLPDLILLAASFGDDTAPLFCKELKDSAETADLPIVMIGDYSDGERRLSALRAGADDVMARPVHDQVLQARIRSLLRARNAAAELRLREDTHRALGLAEPAVRFAAQGRITVIGANERRTQDRADQLGTLTGHGCGASTLQFEHGHAIDLPEARADVIVIDGTGIAPSRLAETLPRLASELRSRTETRNVGQIALLPPDADDTAAILLDIGVNDVVEAPVSDHELALRVEAVLRRSKQQEDLRQTVRDGLRAAITDPLTGLYNRRYAQPHLGRLAERSRVSGYDFAVMVLDIDHFKSINDVYGHAVGDRVLVAVANRLKDCVRSQDLVARIGGEEFLVAMPETNTKEVRAAAERLRQTICNTGFDVGTKGKPLSVTMSIGVAMASQGALGTTGAEMTTCLANLFDRADAALYRAKCSGRNMVEVGLSAA